MDKGKIMFRIYITHWNHTSANGMAIPTMLKRTKEEKAKALARQVAESLPKNMCAEVWPDGDHDPESVYQVVGKLHYF